MGILNLFRKKKERIPSIDNEFVDSGVEVCDATIVHEENDSDNAKECSVDEKDILYGLNEEQANAVMYNGKHLLVLAGAGTGKTKTIISRARYLIDTGVAPHRILILSFTRKSANEIVGRIKSHNNNLQGLSGQTFHSWCFSIIKNNPSVFSNHNFTCLDEEDRESAIKLLCGKNFKDNDNNKVTPSQISKVYSYAVNTLCSLSEAIRIIIYDNDLNDDVKDKIEKNKSVYEDIIRKYIDYKQDHCYLDYDDILNTVAKGLRNNTDAADFISLKYDHILIDEMQDTNPLQYLLLSSFEKNCHLFCVGDDAQSIYAFRGADFKTMHNFTDLIKDSVSQKLDLNYRSYQDILDISNWLLAKSQLDYNKKLKSSRGYGNRPVIVNVNNDWDEADSITKKIIESINNGEKYSDNMVLSRSLYGLKKVEGYCLSRKIPYCVFGGIGLMQSRHVRDVVSVLRIISNYMDELAWMRFLQLWKGVGDITAARIVESMIQCFSLEECIDKIKETKAPIEVYDVLSVLNGLQNNPSLAIKKAVECTSSRMKEIYKEEWEWRKTDFPVLEDVALGSSNISEFVAEYILDPKLDITQKNGNKVDDCVILTTIHSAKGLEAKNCYIVNVSPNAYPSQRSILNGIDAIEEERRCLYVAMTRAKDRLFIYRDIHSLHACESTEKYNGEIKKGDKFIYTKTGDEVIVIDIKDAGNIKYIDYTVGGDWRSSPEFLFRNRIKEVTESQDINQEKSKEIDYYFLNELPLNLVEVENTQPSRGVNQEIYSGSKVDNKLNDFDFN